MTGAMQAVFFDMDGLLLDSERLWLEVESEVMAWIGGSWGSEHADALVGGSLSRTVAYMRVVSGTAVPGEEIGRRLLAGMGERLRTGVPLMAGAEELLREVRDAGVPTALVSSTHRVLMEHALDGIGRRFFSVTVAGDEVGRTKPHPEPYVTAAWLLGVAPARCVALEDSPNGVAAAEAAGCVTVAVPSVLPIPPGPGRLVAGSLTDLDVARLARLVGPPPPRPSLPRQSSSGGSLMDARGAVVRADDARPSRGRTVSSPLPCDDGDTAQRSGGRG